MYGFVKENMKFNGSLLAAFEDIAGEAVEKDGASTDRLRALGIYWIALSHHVEITRLPAQGEIVNLGTRTGKMRPALGMFPRFYDMTDTEGNVLVKGLTVWSLMDAKTRKFADIEGLGINFEDMTQEGDISARVKLPKIELTGHGQIEVVPAFIDANGHMNNKFYIEMSLKAMGIAQSDVKSFYIAYENEAKLGEIINTAFVREKNIAVLHGDTDKKVFKTLFELK